MSSDAKGAATLKGQTNSRPTLLGMAAAVASARAGSKTTNQAGIITFA